MKVLVLAQHDNQVLHSSTRNVMTAAAQISDDITVLVAGHHCAAVAEQAALLAGAGRVLLADKPCYEHQLAENLAALVAELAPGFTHIFGPGSSFGKNVLPRAAALLDVQPLADVIKMESSDTFQRPIYAGNLVARVQSSDAIKVATIRPTAYGAVTDKTELCAIELVESEHDLQLSRRVKLVLGNSSRPELESARVVVAGGRALGSSDNFNLLYQLADTLGGAVGASRAAVDAGFISNELQVGQTGRMVAPELYIAVGISGAIQHIAGIKDSQVIVAINKDPEAAIFSVADYGLVADLFVALPELESQLLAADQGAVSAA